MERLDEAAVTITIMNHPSLSTAYVYVNGAFGKKLAVEPYRFEQEVPALLMASGLGQWIQDALEAVIEAL